MANVNGDYASLPDAGDTTSGAILGDVADMSGSAASAPVRYKKRARDSNGAAPPVPASFVYWNALAAAEPYPSPPPFGGPLVEEVVLAVVLV